MLRFVALLCFSLTYTALGQEEEADACDGCKFFPTVCDKIDLCIEHCNIAPSMAASCTEL
jgi:hypothetical protein